jgi:hypothetical protein
MAVDCTETKKIIVEQERSDFIEVSLLRENFNEVSLMSDSHSGHTFSNFINRHAVKIHSLVIAAPFVLSGTQLHDAFERLSANLESLTIRSPSAFAKKDSNAVFASLTRLTQLQVSFENSFDFVTLLSGASTRLEQLVLARAPSTRPSLLPLDRLRNVKRLFIQDCGLNVMPLLHDVLFSATPILRNLEIVDLSGNMIVDAPRRQELERLFMPATHDNNNNNDDDDAAAAAAPLLPASAPIRQLLMARLGGGMSNELIALTLTRLAPTLELVDLSLLPCTLESLLALLRIKYAKERHTSVIIFIPNVVVNTSNWCAVRRSFLHEIALSSINDKQQTRIGRWISPPWRRTLSISTFRAPPVRRTMSIACSRHCRFAQ